MTQGVANDEKLACERKAKKKTQNDRIVGRHAFTLLETILALALSSFLLVVVFSLVDTTARYHVSGNDQILASERLLGLLQDMRFDLRALHDNPAWHRDDRAPVVDEVELEIARLTQQFQLKELVAAAEPITFVGDRQWMVISLLSPNPRMGTDKVYPQPQQVVWMTGSQEQTVVPTHDDNGRVLTTKIPSLSSGVLWRVELDGLPTSSGRLRPTRVADINSCELRYFDGQRWHASWNSTNRKALPRAIEVNLLPKDSTAQRWVIALATSMSTDRPREVASHDCFHDGKRQARHSAADHSGTDRRPLVAVSIFAEHMLAEYRVTHSLATQLVAGAAADSGVQYALATTRVGQDSGSDRRWKTQTIAQSSARSSWSKIDCKSRHRLPNIVDWQTSLAN